MQTGTTQGAPLPEIFGNGDAKHVNLDETADEALAAVLASLESSNNASVSIYRQGPGGYRDVTFLTECMPAEYSLSRLQDEYGGGVFRVHVREGGKLVANKEVKVAPRPGKQAEPGDVLAPINAQIGALAAAVAKLVEMQAQPARRGEDEDAMLERMLKYKQLFGGGAAPAAAAGDPFDQVTKLLALARDVRKLTGDAPPEPPDGLTVLAETAKSVLPAIVAASQAQRAPVASMRAPVPAAAPPVDEYPGGAGRPPVDNPAPMGSAAPQQQQGNEMMLIKMAVQRMAKEAAQDLDPTGWAHMIINNVAQDQIEGMLRPENWFEALTAFEPQVTPYREWFSELREMVFELLSGAEAGGTTGGNPPTGTNDASGGAHNSNTESNT